jgi:hypothetical protein
MINQKKYKQMRKLAIVSIILSVFMLVACEKSTDLDESIFIPDEDNPELPEYSEWGYNTFGAFYDREAFVSNDFVVPLKVVTESGNTSFIFQGDLDHDRMSIELIMPGFSPATYSDLLNINGITYDLKASGWSVKVIIDGDNKTAEILEGNIVFKRVQKLNVDDKEKQSILSGTFEFKLKVNSVPVNVTDGRFDAGVGKDNFFKL